MILRVPNPQPVKKISGVIPAWDAILSTQKQPSDKWLLVTQSDHAMLAAELARTVTSSFLPALPADVIQAIAVHDDGWKQVDQPQAPHSQACRPLSFFEESQTDIFRAWKGSIDQATEVSPLAGILVSEHFCRIAREFARAPQTPPETAQVLTTFVEREIAHQEDLIPLQSHSSAEIGAFVDTLQFFDLLSLYLCCGSRENVGFPQKFQGKSFFLIRENENCRLEPDVVLEQTRFQIRAWEYSMANSGSVEIPILLAGSR